MNKIDNIEIIKRKELDEKNYFQSIINRGYENKLLTEKDIENLQLQSLELLKTRVERYNGFDSTSISKDTAEIIMASDIYTISVYLKKFKPDEAIKKLKEVNLEKIYNKGRKLIEQKLDICRLLFIRVLKNKINTKNETYNLTIVDGIKGFFKIYNPDFEAHKIKITADYPLYNNLIGKLEGIEFIEEYIKSIYYENQFCQKFLNENIEYLLYGYSKDYKDLIINIFEIVLTATIGCGLADEDIFKLTISSKGLESIYTKLMYKTKEEIYKIINQEYIKIKDNLFMENEELQLYIEKNLFQIQYIIYNATQNRTLDKVFIIQKFVF